MPQQHDRFARGLGRGQKVYLQMVTYVLSGMKSRIAPEPLESIGNPASQLINSSLVVCGGFVFHQVPNRTDDGCLPRT